MSGVMGAAQHLAGMAGLARLNSDVSGGHKGSSELEVAPPVYEHYLAWLAYEVCFDYRFQYLVLECPILHT